MQITVLAAGSQGDVQPHLALAVRLKNEGYRVRLVANTNFAAAASQYGLDFFPIHIDSHQFLQTPQAQRAWVESGSVLTLGMNLTRAIRPLVDQILIDVRKACDLGGDLFLYHSFNLPYVYHIADHLKIPCIPISLHPLPTREHLAMPVKLRRSPGRMFNLLSHWIIQQASWQIFLPVLRRELKGRVAFPYINPNYHLLRDKRQILCAYSPLLLPRPADLPDSVHVTGFWFLDSVPDWKPDPDLVSFIRSGPRPIYVGFGSNPTERDVLVEIVLKALEQAEQRAVISAGWSGLGLDRRLPGNVFLLKDAPHTWLLPQMGAVVHHGGAGTIAASLRAGVPNIVIPHFGDQHYWGKRVAELGAGLDPISRKQLTPERLAEAIRIATQDGRMKKRALEVGEQITVEDGLGRATGLIRAFINSGAGK